MNRIKAQYVMTKEKLREEHIELIANDNCFGGWEVYQYRTDCTGRFKSRRPVYVITTHKHPYGLDKAYPVVSVVIDNKPRMVTLHKLVWIYFNGNYPEGYDICHKDDDAFNCHLENLEVKTHIENIRDKKVFGNQ